VPLWMGLWLACGGDGRDRHPDPTDSTAPDPVVPPRILDAFVREPELAPLARELVVHTDVPTRVTVALSADGVDTAARFPGFSTRHEVPVMGARSGRTHDLTVVVEDEQGQQSGWATTFRTEAVVGPEFPALEVRSRSPEAECDLVLLPLQTPDGRHWLVVVDARDGEVVWWWSSPRDLGDVELTPRGTLLGLSDGILELDWLGNTVRYAHTPNVAGGPDDVVLEQGGLNHEVSELDDGWIAVASRSVVVPAYPKSYVDPTPRVGDTEIVSQDIVQFGFDGAVRSRWPLVERLDPQRIGFDSLDLLGGGYDWSHANAIVEDPGGFVVSVRHQDALVALDGVGGVRWILSNPHGWATDVQGLLLSGLSDAEWPLHQHGPAFDADGNLMVFDNGNAGYTPYQPGPTRPLRSRVAAYAIDEGARTAALAWEWSPPVDLDSPALGNVALLPGGHVFADFGFVSAEDGVDNTLAGRPLRSVRLFELEPGRAEPLLDLSIDTDVDEFPDGVKAYRAIPVPSLYPPGVEVLR
jgi:hypothetical protein